MDSAALANMQSHNGQVITKYIEINGGGGQGNSQ